MSFIKSIAKNPIIALIDSTTTIKELKQIHTKLLINGTLNQPHLLSQFTAQIALKNPTNLLYSAQILDQSENPTLFALNTMIRAHSKSSTPLKSFDYYNRILKSQNHLSPDNYTINFMIRTCAQISDIETGQLFHTAVVKYGFEHDPHVQSGLIYMYAELGSLKCCHKVFGLIHDPDLVTETAMVTACARCGDVDFARKLFDKMPERDAIAWNAMIAGYAQNGESRQALELFHWMQLDGVKINEVSMVSVLTACTHLGAFEQGRWAHAYIERNRVKLTVTLGTALIDMYAKCGNMEKAMEVFSCMKEKNVYTWSSAINGLSMNGDVDKCLQLFSLMTKEKVQPNEVTFVSVLRACSVVGLVELGREHFNSMKNVFNVEPQLEHYGCMVDLYGRAGRLDDALNVVKTMPMEPHSAAWGALLNASRMYDDVELGELASRKLVELEATNHGAYVLMSNIYARSEKWDDVTNVRDEMKINGVTKPPGCSVIEVNGEVNEFIVGDKSHRRYGEIEVVLCEITRRLKLSGYVTNTDPVLFDTAEEEEKEDALTKGCWE